MKCRTISFSGHAVRRMFQRDIKRQEVTDIVTRGETVASYPDDRPHPSFLLLGFAAEKPVHVVLAQNKIDGSCIIITAYIPDGALWSNGFKTRIK
ncbi:MAG: DUF4258 domain-containing protein [Gammaproteobacteria bacterium]|nr:DUF4258 domain-containing protein [Gammaproteobacteria bacterium]